MGLSEIRCKYDTITKKTHLQLCHGEAKDGQYGFGFYINSKVHDKFFIQYFLCLFK